MNDAASSRPGAGRARAVRRVQISSLAVSVPPRILTNSDLEAMVDTSDEWILKRTGVRERHNRRRTEWRRRIWRPRRRGPRSPRRV